MIRSHVIDIGGTFVGAAITQAGGFRFRAANIAVEELDESRWQSLDELKAAVGRLFTTGRLNTARAPAPVAPDAAAPSLLRPS